MEDSHRVARLLLKEKAVFLRPNDPFTWTSGIKSPVYCDNRLLISTVESRKEIVRAFVREIENLNVNLIAGTATAGIPWAAWIAMEMDLPLVYVRSSSKDHGRQNAIEGKAQDKSQCVLIEDLISTGKSSIAAAQKLTEAGVTVKKIQSIFSYGFCQAEEIFKSQGLNFGSLTTFEILAQVAYHDQVLNASDLQQVLEWRKGVVFP